METNVLTSIDDLRAELEGKADGVVYSFNEFRNGYIAFGRFKEWDNFSTNGVVVLFKDFIIDYELTKKLSEIIGLIKRSGEESINGILPFRDELLIYGDFTKWGKNSVNRVLVFNEDLLFKAHKTHQFIKDGPKTGIDKMFVYDGILFASSEKKFNFWGKTSANHLVALNYDHSINCEITRKFVGDGPDGLVCGILSFNDDLIVYGGFKKWSGIIADCSGILENDFTVNIRKTELFSWGPDDCIHKVVPIKKEKLLFAGAYKTWNMDELLYLMVADKEYNIDKVVRDGIASPNDTVYDACVIGDNVVIVGAFTRHSPESTFYLKVI